MRGAPPPFPLRFVAPPHLVFSVSNSFSPPVDRARDLARQLAALLGVPVYRSYRAEVDVRTENIY